mgnify:CR=1 FL=1
MFVDIGVGLHFETDQQSPESLYLFYQYIDLILVKLVRYYVR